MANITTVEGKIVKIIEESDQYQKLQIQIGQKTVKVENGKNQEANFRPYRLNDKVILKQAQTPSGPRYFISDYLRQEPLLVLFLLFVVTVVLVAKKRGVASLLGLLTSFAVIFGYILPNLASGQNPVNVAIAGALVIVPATFFLSHGLNRKTVIAIIATFIALFVTGVLAALFVELARLTGFSSDEAAFLHLAQKGAISMKGLLLAGIIIGVLGVLDDVTISQAAIVFQLKKTDPSLSFSQLVKKTMEIGHDHISSMVNTLVLVYTGASLPLLLLFINNPQPLGQLVSYEMIAEEVIRTLVSSIGLIISVPITTALAAYTATNSYLSGK
ncbi:hypothetical protein A2313_04885 [Candidatus Roizmanbacteria bacterium RIFOXYB2_FULL_41_10]|uniref:YibE/F family protein n=1 Tax=Candidatus Roizmanbacteria bacterium RIFOXYA1_FULL_41_12 TaxID=1802082 RepID=A0A1F7K9H5_9BACT|nr:MAG: hypothetical protein A2209_02245 [Candidatus Roizmanbacteria bacterium RIFOXYA1_FULL_41_12]OGK67282.1 MAG: hypothetical protein A2262_04120 [Candidatus Roizmanbacteria bacterium RIFOXYA2_FULL_41_8]OGK68029.1 MAG: hypothetical protein A2377_04010 [Candidatus Roizmanbacteria bacterium RIFOXYB1_FULL_41_27]OGK69183.1 MAG: hypothetical protein A2313_04885 [Candidatus Roizmanbacteria bacterium RIFOXYB2_FULL_41_10]OGK72229.1 MAG: hypothetical protein A2403_04700 [Candidatus Roizmanbacteria bac